MFQNFTSFLPSAIGVAALAALGLAAYWHFNKAAKKRHVEELRRAYENMSPTDPQYNTARALFIAAMISDSASSHDSESEGGSAGGSSDGQGDDD